MEYLELQEPLSSGQTGAVGHTEYGPKKKKSFSFWLKSSYVRPVPLGSVSSVAQLFSHERTSEVCKVETFVNFAATAVRRVGRG